MLMPVVRQGPAPDGDRNGGNQPAHQSRSTDVQRPRLLPCTTLLLLTTNAQRGAEHYALPLENRHQSAAGAPHGGAKACGRTLQVSPFRRGKNLVCIYTGDRPDLSRELPTWMFDESYCAGMALGPAQVSVEGLSELAAILVALRRNQGPAGPPLAPVKQRRQLCR